MLHSSTDRWGDNVFFTKDCRLETYKNNGKDTLKGKVLYSRTFSQLEVNSCYNSLNFYYSEAVDYISAYNTNFNNIVVYQIKF